MFIKIKANNVLILNKIYEMTRKWQRIVKQPILFHYIGAAAVRVVCYPFGKLYVMKMVTGNDNDENEQRQDVAFL